MSANIDPSKPYFAVCDYCGTGIYELHDLGHCDWCEVDEKDYCLECTSDVKHFTHEGEEVASACIGCISLRGLVQYA